MSIQAPARSIVLPPMGRSTSLMAVARTPSWAGLSSVRIQSLQALPAILTGTIHRVGQILVIRMYRRTSVRSQTRPFVQTSAAPSPSDHSVRMSEITSPCSDRPSALSVAWPRMTSSSRNTKGPRTGCASRVDAAQLHLASQKPDPFEPTPAASARYRGRAAPRTRIRAAVYP